MRALQGIFVHIVLPLGEKAKLRKHYESVIRANLRLPT